MRILLLCLTLTACNLPTENTLPDREWAQFVEEHDCYRGIGTVWKCLYPTPTWWVRGDTE